MQGARWTYMFGNFDIAMENEELSDLVAQNLEGAGSKGDHPSLPDSEVAGPDGKGGGGDGDGEDQTLQGLKVWVNVKLKLVLRHCFLSPHLLKKNAVHY